MLPGRKHSAADVGELCYQGCPAVGLYVPVSYRFSEAGIKELSVLLSCEVAAVGYFSKALK